MSLPDPGLPDPGAAEYWKALADAAVELAKTRVAADLADQTWDQQQRADLRKAEEDEYIAARKDEASADLDIHKQVMAAMIDVAKGSIERSRDSAKFVQASAAALASAYTALLAVVFSIKDHPLPARGFIPTIFLGLATALATAYLAFLTHPQDTKVPPPSSLPRENALRRVVLLIRWTSASVQNRARFLRAAVVALLFGVIFLPAAMISTTPFATTTGANPASPSPSPLAAAAVAAASPAPWPIPPSGRPDAYGIALYRAQLRAHVAALAASTPPVASSGSVEDPGVEQLLWLLAVVGAVVIAAFAFVGGDGRSRRQPGTPPSPPMPAHDAGQGETIPSPEEVESARGG